MSEADAAHRYRLTPDTRPSFEIPATKLGFVSFLNIFVVQERDQVISTYEGTAQESRIDALRENHFQDEAETIAREEQEGFMRFNRPLIYGRINLTRHLTSLADHVIYFSYGYSDSIQHLILCPLTPINTIYWWHDFCKTTEKPGCFEVTHDSWRIALISGAVSRFRSKVQQKFSKGGKIMTEKYSFLVLSDSGKYIKQTHCSRRIVYGIFSVLICLGLIVLFGITDYIRISRKDLNMDHLEAELDLQQQELILYRQQIQRFAKEINEFKHRIVELNRIDQKIRRVADMDESTDLFGIGGSAPEDLNPDLDLERNHTKLIKEMHRQVQNLKHAAAYQHYSLNDLWAVVEERGNFMAYTPTIRPAEGLISSPFGYRVSPFTGNREFHNGLDIANNLNTDIRATANGRIAFAGERRGYGRLVLIDHGHGLVTRYAHLEHIVKKRGDMVKRGEIIAHMGSTGRSTGTHLHYEVRLNGVPVNPLKFVF